MPKQCNSNGRVINCKPFFSLIYRQCPEIAYKLFSEIKLCVFVCYVCVSAGIVSRPTQFPYYWEHSFPKLLMLHFKLCILTVTSSFM